MSHLAKTKFEIGSCIWIDRNKFNSNIRLLRQTMQPKSKLMLVVKSNAYGHGLSEVSKLAIRSKVDYFGVAKPEEVLMLRRMQVRKPILLLAPAHPSCLDQLFQANAVFTVSSAEEALRISRFAQKKHRKPRVHFKVDTGMGRFGSDVRVALNALFQIQKIKNIKLEGIYSHFPDSCTPKNPQVERQIKIFFMLTDLFQELYPGVVRYTHLSNSAAVFNYPVSSASMVRVGISAYGINPGAQHPAINRLKPILSWESYVASIKQFKAGQTLSYDRSHRIKKETRIAVIPVGYASGYPIKCSGIGQVLIQNKRYPIVGRITMDFMMVDLGIDSKVKLWDRVILIGGRAHHFIRVEDIATQAQTIPYDIVCGLSESIPRLIS